ncbi:MAG: J domain-containing protein [Pseudomonadota bacterium]
MAKNLYSTLGVAKSATADEIKRAYRNLAKQYHPDQNKDNQAAQEKFKAITAAYDILGDADKRKQYDSGAIDADGNKRATFSEGFGAGMGPGMGGGERRQSGSWSFDAGSPEDIFQDLFGNFGSRFGGGADPRQQSQGFGANPSAKARGGKDVNYEITVDFLDATRGAEKKLALQGAKTVAVRIPAGIKDGQQIRLSGQGDAGGFGSKAGDALVTVHVRDHETFTRDGTTIRMTQNIDLDTAVLGGKVTIPTISGSVAVTVAPGTSSGMTIRLRGKGIAAKGKTPGDQLVTYAIVIPKDDAQLKKAIGAWAKKAKRATQDA